MIIQWKESRILGLSVPGKSALAFVLSPGVNIVPDNIWAACQKQKSVKAKIEKKTLVMIEGTVEETEQKGPGGKVMDQPKITVTSKEPWKLTAPVARELVPDTHSIDVLEAWLKNEAKDEIRALLSNKITEMKK